MAKVLVVDDDPGIVSLLQRIITKRGYETFVARDGTEGLELAQQHHPDLIFTDIKMPDLGGEELTRILKADPEFADIPIIILSGTAFLIDLETTQASSILTKPFELKTVYSLLERFLPLDRGQSEAASSPDKFNARQIPVSSPSDYPPSV